jgi:hypothetical protein
MLCRSLLFILLALPLQLHAASPVKARSLSGSGLLLLNSENRAGALRLVLYREPGIGRIAELAATQLPQIIPPLQASAGGRGVIVTAKRLDWYRIVYDNGEREGWIKGGAAFIYQRWGELLPRKTVVFPSGLRKEFYQLRSQPDPAAEAIEAVAVESGLTVIRVVGDWINVRRGTGVSGWLRWRDDNGRLLIAVDYGSKDK